MTSFTDKAELNVRDGTVEILEEIGPMIQFDVELPALLGVEEHFGVEELVVAIVGDLCAGQYLVQFRGVAHKQARIQETLSALHFRVPEQRW